MRKEEIYPVETQAQNRINRGILLLKGLLFLAIGVGLFFMLQRLFLPKDITDVINPGYFVEHESQNKQVLLLGSSHMTQGVYPMELYEQQGIVSYNAATGAQTMASSYLMLSYALKQSDLEVCVLDVSGLFYTEEADKQLDIRMRYVIDALPLCREKLELAWIYAGLAEEKPGEAFWSALFPLLQYHSRWDELEMEDFSSFFSLPDYHNMGAYMCAYSVPGRWSQEDVNAIAEAMSQSDTAVTVTYENGQTTITTQEDPLYTAEIPQENLEWLLKIRDLCDQHGCQLLLTKVPCLYGPNEEWSAWTEQRSDAVKAMSETYGLDFLDLLYDVDLGIQVETDTMDGGAHLNYLGAQKVTAYLGSYLKEHYQLEARVDPGFEAELEPYHKNCQIAELGMTTDMVDYLSQLAEHQSDWVICLAAGGDMRSGLTDAERAALKELGLQADFEATPGVWDSYLAVLDGGEVVYEAASNRALSDTWQTSAGTELELSSAGFLAGDAGSITVDGTVKVSGSGLNLVVLDRETGLPVDCLTFPTNLPVDQGDSHSATRDLEQVCELFLDYWKYSAVG